MFTSRQATRPKNLFGWPHKTLTAHTESLVFLKRVWHPRCDGLSFSH